MRTPHPSASCTSRDLGTCFDAAPTRRSTAPFFVTSLVLTALAACALPPPAEDKPLTGEFDGEPGRPTRVDSTLDARTPDSPINSEIDSDETSMVEVSSDAEAKLDRVEAPEETVVEGDTLANAETSDESGGADREHGDSSVDRTATAGPPSKVPTVDRSQSGAPADQAPASASDQDGDQESSEQTAPGEPTDLPEERVFKTSDDLAMHYTIAGRGPLAVVFIHGWCGDAAQWQSHIAPVAKRYRVIAVDLVGHGRSSEELRDTWTIPRLAEDVAGLLEAEKLENVVLVGHAMGNSIALTVAALANERVAAVIGVQAMHRLAGEPDPTVAETVNNFRAEYKAEMAKFVDDFIGETTSIELKSRIARDHVNTNQEVALSLMEHFGEHDVRPALAGLDCRVIAINGTRWPTSVEENLGLLPAFELVLVEHPGYWLQLESPDAFRARLLENLKRLEPESTETVLAELATVLYTGDVTTLSRFYGTSLAFTEVERVPADLELDAVFVAMERDGNRIEIRSVESAEEEMPGVQPTVGGGVIAMGVPALGAEKERLGDGVEVVLETGESGENGRAGTGRRQVVVKDPVGNLIVLRERL